MGSRHMALRLERSAQSGLRSAHALRCRCSQRSHACPRVEVFGAHCGIEARLVYISSAASAYTFEEQIDHSSLQLINNGMEFIGTRL